MMPDFYKHTYHFNMIHGKRLLMHHWVRRWGESMEEGHIVSAALWWLDWMCSSHRWRPCIHWPQISEVFPAFRLLMKESPLLPACFTKNYRTKLLYKASSESVWVCFTTWVKTFSSDTLGGSWLYRLHVLKEETGHRLIFSFIFQVKVYKLDFSG